MIPPQMVERVAIAYARATSAAMLEPDAPRGPIIDGPNPDPESIPGLLAAAAKRMKAEAKAPVQWAAKPVFRDPRYAQAVHDAWNSHQPDAPTKQRTNGGAE